MVLEFLVKQLFKLSRLNELCQAFFPWWEISSASLLCISALCRESHFWREIRQKEKGATPAGGYLSMQEAKSPHPSTWMMSVIGCSYFPPNMLSPSSAANERAWFHLQNQVPRNAHLHHGIKPSFIFQESTGSYLWPLKTSCSELWTQNRGLWFFFSILNLH